MQKSNKDKVNKTIEDALSSIKDYEENVLKLAENKIEDVSDTVNVSEQYISSLDVEACSFAIFKLNKYCLAVQRSRNKNMALVKTLKSKKKQLTAYILKQLCEDNSVNMGWNERTKVAEDMPGLMEPVNDKIREIEICLAGSEGIIENIREISKTYLDRKFYLMQRAKYDK